MFEDCGALNQLSKQLAIEKEANQKLRLKLEELESQIKDQQRKFDKTKEILTQAQ